MALHRFALTNNGKHLAKQRKALFGWRTLFYLDSEIRKEEESMNALLKKFEERARKRAALQDQRDELITAIKSSDTEVNDEGKTFEEATGFSGWVRSFFRKPLHPEQKTSWKKFYDLMKADGLLKSSVRKVMIAPQSMTVGTTQHRLVPENNQSRKQRAQQNSQQNQQHQ